MDHAEQMFVVGVITRPGAVAALRTTLQPGQLFRAGIKFADEGAEPNHAYSDNGYMSNLSFAPSATFNRQVATWMRSANRLDYHDAPARTEEVRNALSAEIASQSPGFATPTLLPGGLMGP